MLVFKEIVAAIIAGQNTSDIALDVLTCVDGHGRKAADFGARRCFLAWEVVAEVSQNKYDISLIVKHRRRTVYEADISNRGLLRVAQDPTPGFWRIVLRFNAYKLGSRG